VDDCFNQGEEFVNLPVKASEGFFISFEIIDILDISICFAEVIEICAYF